MNPQSTVVPSEPLREAVVKLYDWVMAETKYARESASEGRDANPWELTGAQLARDLLAAVARPALPAPEPPLGDGFPGMRQATLNGLQQLVSEDKYNGFIGETCRNAIALIAGTAIPAEHAPPDTFWMIEQPSEAGRGPWWWTGGLLGSLAKLDEESTPCITADVRQAAHFSTREAASAVLGSWFSAGKFIVTEHLWMRGSRPALAGPLTDEQLLAAFLAGEIAEHELNEAEMSVRNVRKGIAAAMRAALSGDQETTP